jgi:hypothetical protein
MRTCNELNLGSAACSTFIDSERSGARNWSLGAESGSNLIATPRTIFALGLRGFESFDGGTRIPHLVGGRRYDPINDRDSWRDSRTAGNAAR